MRLNGDSVVEKVLRPDNALEVLGGSGSEMADQADAEEIVDNQPQEQTVPAERSADEGPLSSPEEAVEEEGGEAMSSMDDIDLDEYADAMQDLREGDIVRGIVVQVDEDGAMVDVGTKSEGLIPRAEVEALGPDELERGKEIEVYVVRIEDEEGNLILSKRQADYERSWREIIQAKEDGRIITATVTDAVRGGLLVDLGAYGQGFVPASHVSLRRPRNLSSYVGQSLRLKVIEVDPKRKRVVLSHRLVVEEERARTREETLASLAEGQIREGIVRRLTDFGAFVDLGGVDGLLHISEMSWTHINHPSEVLKKGDKIQVMVLKFDREENRISLGRRQLLPDPWREVPRLYREGQVVRGEVTRIVPSGAFVRLPNGIEGFAPASELGVKKGKKLEDTISVGEEIEVKILQIRPEERRIVLSKIQAEEEKARREYSTYLKERQTEARRPTLGDVYGDLLRERRAQVQKATEPEEGEESS